MQLHPRRRYGTSEVAAHVNAEHYRAAMKHWTDDDEVSLIAPTLDNPYCIQPYDPALYAAGSIGASHDCTFASKHELATDATATWSLKPWKSHWYAMCDRHASVWTGWDKRLRPVERLIRVLPPRGHCLRRLDRPTRRIRARSASSPRIHAALIRLLSSGSRT